MSKLDAQSLLSEQSSNEQNIQEVLQSKDTSHSEDYKNQSVTNNNQDNSDEQENLTDKSDEIKDDENKIHVDQVSAPIESNTVSDKLESNVINTQSATPEPDDVLGNKSLLKQTITPGEPDTRPTRNCLATISYKLYLIDDATSNSRLIETITNESFFIGEYDVLSAIDLTIQLMDRGEHALIDADLRHCYGENGCEEKQIPPLSSTNSYRMKIDLEFHDWKPPIEIPTLNINERLTWGDKKRERGNFLYRRKEYSSATHCYQNALKFLDPNENPLLEEDEEQSPLLINKYIQVQNNLAQVYLSNNKYEDCLNAIEKVLELDKLNIKALFRQAKAFIELGNYDNALQPLKFLLENQNDQIEKDTVKEMLQFCQKKLAKYHQNEKEICKRMFQSTTTTATTTANDEESQLEDDDKIETKPYNWRKHIGMVTALLIAIILAIVATYR